MFSDIFNYLIKLLLLWGERLFAQDVANPHYRYAWAPQICGRHVGFVICSKPNEVKAYNTGPIMEKKDDVEQDHARVRAIPVDSEDAPGEIPVRQGRRGIPDSVER